MFIFFFFSFRSGESRIEAEGDFRRLETRRCPRSYLREFIYIILFICMKSKFVV